LSVLFIAFSGVINASSSDSDSLQGSVSYGYDSNPFKLSSPDTSQSEAEYKALTLKYQGDSYLSGKKKQGKNSASKAKKANLLYRLKLNKRIYSHSRSAGDNFRLDGHLRWIERFKMAERKASLLVSADIRSERNTYYSQTQRQIAETSDGDLIDNRFSYDAAGVTAELVYYANKKKSWSLLTQFGQRSYVEDYRDIGLEALDFNEFRLQPSFRFKTDSGSSLRVFAYHKFRDYQGLQNESVDDSSLVGYTLNGYGLVLSQSVTERLESSVYLSGYFARDNGAGLRDLNYHSVVINVNYQLDTGGELQFNSQAYQREYLNPGFSPAESEISVSGGQRNGLMAEVRLSKPLVWAPLTGLVSLRKEQERNSTEGLSYQRYLIEVGLQFQL